MSAIRGHDEVVFSRVDLEVVDRLSGHVIFHFAPAFSGIDRDIHGKFCSHKQKVGILVVFSYHVDRLIGQIGRDGCPGFSIVCCFVHERPKIIPPVSRVRDISCARIIR